MRNALVILLVGLVGGPPAWAGSSEEKPLIQIGVEVVEVDELRAQNLGVKWLSSLHVEELIPVPVPSLLEVGKISRDALFADIQFLETNGAADLLANPKLVARDGTDASFHAGGEIPYATTASVGAVTVVFKPYGVNLKMNAHVNENGRIELSVDAQVSGLDSQNGVSLSGNVVPAIRSRQVISQLTVNPGSTLTMAGLIQNDKEWVRNGIPGLMHIPFLGRLFSHKLQVNRRTSIVVFVTPTILNVGTASASRPFSLYPTVHPKPAEPQDEDLPDLTGANLHG